PVPHGETRYLHARPSEETDDMKHPVQMSSVDDRAPRPRAGDREVVRDVEIPCGGGVLTRSRDGENVRAGRYAYAVRARPCVRLLDRRPQRALTGQRRTHTVARPGVYGIGRTVDREVGGHGAVGAPHQGEGGKGEQESARRMSSRSTATLETSGD